MKYYISTVLIFWAIVSKVLGANKDVDSLLNILDNEILISQNYLNKKISVINGLKAEIKKTTDLHNKFVISSKIYDQYKSLQYDSAYHYAQKSLEYASLLENKNLILKAKNNLLFCFISSGSFCEAVFLVHSTDLQDILKSEKSYFYALCARLYSDMSSNNQIDTYKQQYLNKSIEYCDSTMAILDHQSYNYHSIEALRSISNSISERISKYSTLLNDFETDIQQKAINAANLANLYLIKKDTIQAIRYWTISAINDTRASIMETTSKTDLATQLFIHGELQRASNYINAALTEAEYYSAKHRIVSINSIMPIIEKKNLATIKDQRDQLKFNLISVTILLVLLTFTTILVYRKNKKMQLAKQEIERQSLELSKMNELLKLASKKQEELNRIKNVYIKESLYARSEYLDKTETMLRKISNQLRSTTKTNLTNLTNLGIELNIKQERKEFFTTFDKAFLILFPTFIEEYNKLFPPEFHVKLEANKALPAEIRIFAFMRLGVDDSEKIAKFLNLSINTIYTYKAKIKNKTIVNKEEFENNIMEIGNI